MAFSADGIIMAVEGETPKRVSFMELLANRAAESGADPFLALDADGRLPEPEPVEEEPEISREELERQQREALEKEVYQKVFAAAEKAGLELGQQKAERELNRLMPQLESALRRLDALPERVFAASERFLIETAILLTRELLRHELTVQPEGIAERVRHILKNATGRQEVVIHLSPGHAEIMGRLNGFHNLRIEADPKVAPGSVHMESDFGGVEDHLERRLQEVENGLRDYLQERLEESRAKEIAAAAEEARRIARQRALTDLIEDPAPAPEPEVAPEPEPVMMAAPVSLQKPTLDPTGPTPEPTPEPAPGTDMAMAEPRVVDETTSPEPTIDAGSPPIPAGSEPA